MDAYMHMCVGLSVLASPDAYAYDMYVLHVCILKLMMSFPGGRGGCRADKYI